MKAKDVIFVKMKCVSYFLKHYSKRLAHKKWTIYFRAREVKYLNSTIDEINNRWYLSTYIIYYPHAYNINGWCSHQQLRCHTLSSKVRAHLRRANKSIPDYIEKFDPKSRLEVAMPMNRNIIKWIYTDK